MCLSFQVVTFMFDQFDHRTGLLAGRRIHPHFHSSEFFHFFRFHYKNSQDFSSFLTLITYLYLGFGRFFCLGFFFFCWVGLFCLCKDIIYLVAATDERAPCSNNLLKLHYCSHYLVHAIPLPDRALISIFCV